MSLLTRCPACETCYRVVPDQLRVSEGWVRCGQCMEIFDAVANQLGPADGADDASDNADDLARQSDEPQHAVSPEPSAAIARSESASTAVQAEPHTSSALPQTDSGGLVSSNDSDQLSRNPTVRVHGDGSVDRGVDPPFDPDRVLHARPSAQLAPEQASQAGSDQPPLRHDPDWPLHIVPQEVTFLKPRVEASASVPAGSRWALAMLALALLLALPAQWVYLERHQLALTFPIAQPYLAAACRALNCRLEPVRRIEAVVIDNSSLTAMGKTAYRLNLALTNTSQYAVALPHVEVTLTDTLDQALVRRVLSPDDMGLAGETLGAGQTWPVKKGIELTGKPPIDGISGYRLLAFYP